MKRLDFGLLVKAALSAGAALFLVASCEELDDDIERRGGTVQLENVAALLSVLPLEQEQMDEVHRAVSSSSGNGYDEEYLMSDLFALPGKGVGEETTKALPRYSRPLRDVMRDYVAGISSAAVKAPVKIVSGIAGQRRCGTASAGLDALLRDVKGSPESAGGRLSKAARRLVQTEDQASEGLGFVPDEQFLTDIEHSDIQIYWPYSENWDGETLPIISFDPGDDSEVNAGYRLVRDAAGEMYVEEILVDEEMAKNEPVWVVNTNSDSDYLTLDLMRKRDPSWGEGGTVIVKSNPSEEATKSLILKEFTAKRNFDCWFAGASEFFVKAGAVEDFSASTEAELRLYSPTVTDFMIVVKRKQVGEPLPFNAVLVSEWTKDMTHCAFMITEDDGGTVTQWKCTAIVKVASKSYGVDISLPFNSRDDIVWRGQLSRKYLDANSNLTGHFGDVDLVFEVVAL